jgi:hypothetical protein
MVSTFGLQRKLCPFFLNSVGLGASDPGGEYQHLEVCFRISVDGTQIGTTGWSPVNVAVHDLGNG